MAAKTANATKAASEKETKPASAKARVAEQTSSLKESLSLARREIRSVTANLGALAEMLQGVKMSKAARETVDGLLADMDSSTAATTKSINGIARHTKVISDLVA